jgi:hypothetical protein
LATFRRSGAWPGLSVVRVPANFVGVTQDEKIFYSSAHYDIDVKFKFIFLISFAFTSRLTSHLAICLIFRCLAGSGDSTQLSAVSLALLFVQRSEKRQLNATDTLEEDHVPVNTSACANIAQSLRLPRPLSRESDKNFSVCSHLSVDGSIAPSKLFRQTLCFVNICPVHKHAAHYATVSGSNSSLFGIIEEKNLKVN